MPAFAGKQAWTEWVDRARNAPILPLAQSHGATRLKKSGTTEWIGPCPVCGGTDRFSVNVKKNIFNCRGCTIGGDTIKMVVWITGCAWIEAIEKINGTPRPDRSRDETLEERNARLSAHATARTELQQQHEAEQRAEELAKAKRDEEAIAAVISRATPIWGTHAEAYVRGRGLNPHKRLMGDIRFVQDLDYWGARDNGTRSIVHLATLPAIVAVIRDFSGNAIGLSQTYLDPKEPRKWKPEGSPTNSPTKIRGDKKGGMIWLGGLKECLVLAEGWANALAFHQLGYGPEDVALAAAIDIGNLAGGALGWVPHPVLKDGDGRPIRIKNGVHDPAKPGVILPQGIKSIILLADLDSETYATAAHLRTAVSRFQAAGMEVEIAWPGAAGKDWNDVVVMEAGAEDGRTVSP
jgi:hypothetical protein